MITFGSFSFSIVHAKNFCSPLLYNGNLEEFSTVAK